MTETGDTSDGIAEMPMNPVPSTDPEVLLGACVISVRDESAEKREENRALNSEGIPSSALNQLH